MGADCVNMKGYSWLSALVLLGSAGQSLANLDKTSPDESLYDVTLYLSDRSQCRQQDYTSICSALTLLDYKQCSLLTTECNSQTKLRVAFSSYRNKDSIDTLLANLKLYKGISITKTEVDDVNECLSQIHTCSKNGYCINDIGKYRCNCGPGYQEPRSSTTPQGTVCVARCNLRSCRNGGSCTAATAEGENVTCQCRNGYTGETCQQQPSASSLPEWTVILIAIVAAVSALVGLSLCGYAGYRLFCKRVIGDDESDLSSIHDFKPSAISRGDYDRMTDIGSWSRVNRALTPTIEEEPASQPVKARQQKSGAKLMSSRLSIPSEHGDPTPVLDPFNRTERHNVSDIVTQPDYY